MTDLDKAREWAERWEVGTEENDPFIDWEAAAANRIIKSLPDQWVDVEKVREAADRMDKGAVNAMKPGHNEFSRGYAEAMRECAGHLRDLMPTPSLPEPSDWQDDRFTGWLLNENVAVKVNQKGAVIIEHMNVGWFALPPEEASRFADMIKAAANYAEQGKSND